MTIWNTGSIATHVGNLVGWGNVPTNVSGAVLNEVVTQELNFVNTLTNAGLVTTSIAEKYQPALISLSMSKLLLSIEANQGGIDSVSLSKLSISQGNSSNSEIAKQMRIDAIKELKELGRFIRYARVIGGA